MTDSHRVFLKFESRLLALKKSIFLTASLYSHLYAVSHFEVLLFSPRVRCCYYQRYCLLLPWSKKKLALYVIIAQLAGMFRVLKLKIVAISKVQVIPKGWKLEKIYTTSLLITKVQFKSSLVGR